MNKPVYPEYSPVVADALANRITAMQAQNTALHRNTIVCIAGGSSTGKSTQIAADLRQRLQPDAQLLAQDHFQLGIDYADPDPIYRWDALANYGLPESAALLRALRAGEPVEMPVYTFQQFRRTGLQQIQPTPIVLFDGLYAGFGELRSLADLVVYVESTLLARMLRRVFRSCFERYRADPAHALKSFLTGGVLPAHSDLVRQQRETADVIVRMPYQFSDTIRRFNLQKTNDTSANESVFFALPIDSQSALRITQDIHQQIHLRLFHQDCLYFSFPIDAETYAEVIAADWDAY